ncbi:MAG: hypothetical protein ACRYGP_08680, partial [Janthinobacterium lividum]
MARATCFAVPTGIGSMPDAEKSGFCAAVTADAATSWRGSAAPTTIAVRTNIVKTVLTRRMMAISGAMDRMD